MLTGTLRFVVRSVSLLWDVARPHDNSSGFQGCVILSEAALVAGESKSRGIYDKTVRFM
jgi:hypothetical protein